MLVEPFQGTAGNVIPPDEFLPAVKEIARENDAVLIADEMITGFGRTGKMWGVEHTGVQPDIMTVGKGMGSGFPVSGVLLREEVAQAKPFSKPSASSSSYGGNPLAAVAVGQTLRSIQEEHLVENSRTVGATLLARLLALKEKFEFVGDVRGRGLMIGIDLVRDRHTRQELSRRVIGGRLQGGAQARPADHELFPAHPHQSPAGHHRGAGGGRSGDTGGGFHLRARPLQLA